MNSQERPWIVSGNAIPLLALGGVFCRFLGMEISYQRFTFERTCVLLEWQSCCHTRVVDICLLLLWITVNGPEQESHHVIRESQAPCSLQRWMCDFPIAFMFQSLSRHHVMIMYSAMSLFFNYLNISSDSRVVRYRLKMVQRNELKTFLCKTNHFLWKLWKSSLPHLEWEHSTLSF